MTFTEVINGQTLSKFTHTCITSAEVALNKTIDVCNSAKTILEDRKLPIEIFERIKDQQIPDKEKRKKAHFIISTDQSIEGTEKEVELIVEEFKKIKTEAWIKHYSN